MGIVRPLSGARGNTSSTARRPRNIKCPLPLSNAVRVKRLSRLGGVRRPCQGRGRRATACLGRCDGGRGRRRQERRKRRKQQRQQRAQETRVRKTCSGLIGGQRAINSRPFNHVAKRRCRVLLRRHFGWTGNLLGDGGIPGTNPLLHCILCFFLKIGVSLIRLKIQVERQRSSFEGLIVK